jgi:hypothetical protein
VPRLTFTAGEILTAANLNVVSDQSVMVFDDSAARSSAIPSPSEGMLTYLKDSKNLQRWTGSVWVNVVSGFTASTTVTASNSSWPVPALASPIVKVTVIGGGGGGGAAINNNGGSGGASSFTISAGSLSASGGQGGLSTDVATAGRDGTAGFAAGNFGTGGNDAARTGGPGTGGEVRVAYFDLTGVSTANVVVGAGGAGGSAGTRAGGAGGRGEVIVEYVAG